MQAEYVILAKNKKAACIASDVLDRRKVPYICHIGQYAGQIGELTEKITSGEGKKKLIVVGGDGLLNEVVNHVARFSDIALGLIPAGSGNDFARAMGIPKNPKKAMEMILQVKEERRLDIGLVRTENRPEKRFLVSTGVGFDAAVCVGVDRFPMKKMLGKLGLAQFVYTLAALPKLLSCRHLRMSIAADGQQICDGPVFFSAVMNTCYEGGGYKFCPDADPESGCLDIVIASGIRQWAVPRLLLLCRKGEHRRMKQIRLLRAKEICMKAEKPAAVHTDGEVYGFAEQIFIRPAKEKVRFLI